MKHYLDRAADLLAVPVSLAFVVGIGVLIGAVLSQ